MKTIITIEIIERADFQYRAQIKAEEVNFRGWITPKILTEDDVKQLTRMFIHSQGEWSETRLRSIKMLEVGLWEVLLIKPYPG